MTLFSNKTSMEYGQRLTADPRVQSQVSSCGIGGGQTGIGTIFSPSTSYFLCQLSLHQCFFFHGSTDPSVPGPRPY